jgi:hypothetical protein
VQWKLYEPPVCVCSAATSGVLTASSLDDAMRVVAQYTACVIENVYVCGGASAYREAFASAACERLYVTNILQDCKCDTFVPQVDVNQWEIDQIGDVQTENGIAFQFNVYTRTETKQGTRARVCVCVFSEYVYLCSCLCVFACMWMLAQSTPRSSSTSTSCKT